MVEIILRVFVLMIFMLFWSEAKVVWKVEKKISDYGEDLVLLCMPEEYEMSSPKSKRWYQGQKLLTFNNGSEDNTKYKASIESNGFKLIIKNLTKNDVNITYMCSYSFSKSENLLLQTDDVFKDLQNGTVHTGMVIESDSTTGVIFGIVFGITAVFIVIFVFVILYRKKKLKILTKICYGESHSVEIQRNEEQIPLPTLQPDIIGNQQPNRVICKEGNGNHQLNGVPSETTENTTNVSLTQSQSSQVTIPQDDGIIENTPSSSNTPPQSIKPVIATSVSRLGGCIAQESQQPGGDEMETTHAAESARSEVSSQQKELVLCKRDFQFTKQNKEEASTKISGKFPAYSKQNFRKQSFTEWSLIKPSIQEMASAGFFYRGCQTIAQCFCCGSNRKWKENEDPFSSILHLDNCSYLQKVTNTDQDSNSCSPDSDQTNPKSIE